LGKRNSNAICLFRVNGSRVGWVRSCVHADRKKHIVPRGQSKRVTAQPLWSPSASPCGDNTVPTLHFFLFQLVRAIHRREFVALGQRRIVEHVADQVAHRAVQVHHQLPDVHEFAGLLADDVHAE
jgi:hypothetical protein